MKRIIYLIGLIFSILLYYLSNNTMKVIITFNFGLYVLLEGLFNTATYDKKNLFKNICCLIFIGVIIYFTSGYININNIKIYNLCTLFFALINNLIGSLDNSLHNYRGSKYITRIYYFLILSVNAILVIILKNRYNILILYGSAVITFAIILLLLIVRKKKINILPNTNKEKNIIISSYLYISIVALYFILSNKYNYGINYISTTISDSYLFGIIFIYIIYKIISKNIKLDYADIKNNFNNNINKVLNIDLNVSIFLLVISYPLCKIIFNSDYNFLFGLIILLFSYIIFNSIYKISIEKISNKKINISLMTGLFIKIILEIPFINSFYRMGYNLSLGGILSSSLGLFISGIIIIIFIIRKYKINMLEDFNNIMNIIYNNIIYTLILVLFTLFVKVDSDKYCINILTILFYFVISIIFFSIKKLVLNFKNR